MKPLAICIFALLGLITKAQDPAYVYFETDKYNLDENDKSIIAELVKEKDDSDGNYFYISGFTDADGSGNYNMKLSFQRVTSVYNYLLERGINPSRIKMDWAGENRPFAENSTDEGKQRNRCVELQSSYFPPKGFTAMQSYHNVFNENRITDQEFSGFSDLEIRIKGNQGTIITIPANSLTDAKGREYRGIVSISLKEVYSIKDIVDCNLSTTSEENIIETGGMIKITVKGTYGELSLKPGTYAEVLMPTTEPQEDMQVFYGKYNNGIVDWTTSNSIEDQVTVIETKIQKEEDSDTITKDIFNNFRLDVSAVKNPKQPELSKYNPQYYNLQIDGFSWINCDRYAGRENLAELRVNVNSNSVAKVVLVLEDIKSIINGKYNPNNEMVSFPPLPENMNGTLIAICINDEGNYLETKKVVIGKDKIVKLFPEKTSKTEMELAIATLGIN